MTRSLPLAAVLAVVLHVAAPAMASGGTGKVLVTDLNKGKIDVYDPNTNDWKLFTLLRKTTDKSGKRIASDDQNNWAAGSMVQHKGCIYAISTCTESSCSQNLVLKINATTGKVIDDKFTTSTALRNRKLYDLALKHDGSALLVATDQGIKEISTDPANAGSTQDYWASSSDWRRAEIEVEPTSGDVYVLLYAKGNGIHFSTSTPDSNCMPGSGEKPAMLYKCAKAARTCSASAASTVNLGTKWSFAQTDIAPSPQSLLVFTDSATSKVNVIVVERDNDGAETSCTVSNPAASGNQGVHKYVLSSSGAATYSYLLPMSEVESNKAAGTAKSNFVAVTAKAKTSAFDFMSVQLSPDNFLYVTDYSAYNTPLILTLAGAPGAAGNPAAQITSQPFLGQTTNIVPTGFTLFTDGPFAPLCLVDEWTSNWGDALPRADVFEAGATPSLTVTAKNVQNAAYTGGDGDFHAVLSGRITVSGEQIAVTSKLRGTAKAGSSNKYTVKYQAPLQKAGSFTIRVVSGADGGFAWDIASSPKMVHVRAAKTSAAHCVTSIVGTQVAIAGQPATVTLTTYDQYGNPSGLRESYPTASGSGSPTSYAATRDFFVISIKNSTGGITQFAMSNTAEGKYSGTYSATKAVGYRLSVSQRASTSVDCTKSGSSCQTAQSGSLPVDLVVRATAVSAAACTATGPSYNQLTKVYSITDTYEVHWYVAAKDKYNNIIQEEHAATQLQDDFTLELGATPTQSGGFPKPEGEYKAPPGKLTSKFDTSKAQFLVTYKQNFVHPSANGSTYYVRIKLKNAAIAGSPFTVSVSSKGGYMFGNNTYNNIEMGIVYKWPHGLAILVIVIACICIVLALYLMSWIQMNRLQTVVAVSSPFMMNVILLGSIACYLTVIFQAIEPKDTPTLCLVRQWMPNISFSWLWGAVMLKLRRTYLVAVKGEEGKLKRTKSFMKKERRGEIGASNKDLMTHLGMIVGFEALIQIVYAISGGPKLNNFEEGMEGYEGVPPAEFCYSAHSVFFFWLDLLYHCALLIYTIFLAFQTRKIQKTNGKQESRAVQKMLNESLQFSFAIYNTIVVLLAAHAMSANAMTDPGTMLILDAVSSLFPPVVASIALIGPKVWMIKYGEHSMKSVMGLKRQQEMKRGGGHMSKAKLSTQPSPDMNRASTEALTADSSFDAPRP